MTIKELNRDIKKLHNEIKNQSSKAVGGDTNTDYFNYIEGIAKPEFIRLYNADNTLSCVSKYSLLVLLRLNVRHRFIPFHQFGLNIHL